MPRFLVALLGLSMIASAGMAQVDASPAEEALLQMANQVRAEHGVAPLAWNKALARAARAHAKRVVSEPGELEHQYPGEPDVVARASHDGALFSAVAENLARGGQNPSELQQVWMSTPVHRANLLDPKMNAVGIGVIESGGLLSAVEDFAHTVTAPKRDDIESQVMKALQKAGISSVKMTDAARSNCESQSNTAAGAQLVVHWEGSNLDQLPNVLVQRIARGTYQSAAVGGLPECTVKSGILHLSGRRAALLRAPFIKIRDTTTLPLSSYHKTRDRQHKPSLRIHLLSWSGHMASARIG